MRGVSAACDEAKAYALGLVPELFARAEERAATLGKLCRGGDALACARLRDAGATWREEAQQALASACRSTT